MKAPRLGRTARRGLIAGIVTFALLAGTGVGWAYWNAQATASLSGSAANLTITASGTMPSATVGNENISAVGSATLLVTSSTTSMTFTNTTQTTSPQQQTLSVTFSAAPGGDTALAAATTVWVWKLTGTSCPASAPGGSPSGNWSTGVTVTTPLAGNGAGTVTYCILSAVSGDRQSIDSAGGTLTFTPQATATLSASNFTKSTTTTASTPVKTQYIYPLQAIGYGWWQIKSANGWCVDVYGGFTSSGTRVISYDCKASNNYDTNQDFRYVDSGNTGYGDLQPRVTGSMRVAVPASTAPGGAATLQTANSSDSTQRWQPQLVSPGVYQLVNRYSGLCLNAPPSQVADINQQRCNGSVDQRFSFILRGQVQLTCTNVGSGSSQSVSYSWDGTGNPANGPYTIQAQQSGSSGWTSLATTNAGTASAPVASVSAPIGAPVTDWSAGFWGGGATYSVRVIDTSNNVVGTSSFVQRADGAFGSGYRYLRCS